MIYIIDFCLTTSNSILNIIVPSIECCLFEIIIVYNKIIMFVISIFFFLFVTSIIVNIQIDHIPLHCCVYILCQIQQLHC